MRTEQTFEKNLRETGTTVIDEVKAYRISLVFLYAYTNWIL